MDKKKMLKIAYAIAQFQDFVTNDLGVQEYGEIEYTVGQTLSPEEIQEVIEVYDGYGMDKLDDEIREEYFKD